MNLGICRLHYYCSYIYLFTYLFSQNGAGKKKGKGGRKQKQSKNKNNQRKNTKKTNMPHGGNDLTQKIFSTMEKHKEVGNNL